MAVALKHVSTDDPEFNFGKILRLSRLLKNLSSEECIDWLVSCYLPTVHTRSSLHSCSVSVQDIIFSFLKHYHTKTNNPLTNEQFNQLINYKPQPSQSIAKKTACAEPIQPNQKAIDEVKVKSENNIVKSRNNNDCMIYRLPETVISNHLLQFVSLYEIVKSFSRVCSLFAICCEDANVVESFTINKQPSRASTRFEFVKCPIYSTLSKFLFLVYFCLFFCFFFFVFISRLLFFVQG